jgi:cellulose synthase/poly-beta-1,6-N-acetylglucosamine synthase-like glycosyltransferase
MSAPSAPNISSETAPEVTVVIPCLNEEKTVGGCVERAVTTM